MTSVIIAFGATARQVRHCQSTPSTYEFATPAEAEAFLRGVKEAVGANPVALPRRCLPDETPCAYPRCTICGEPPRRKEAP